MQGELLIRRPDDVSCSTFMFLSGDQDQTDSLLCPKKQLQATCQDTVVVLKPNPPSDSAKKMYLS